MLFSFISCSHFGAGWVIRVVDRTLNSAECGICGVCIQYIHIMHSQSTSTRSSSLIFTQTTHTLSSLCSVLFCSLLSTTLLSSTSSSQFNTQSTTSSFNDIIADILRLVMAITTKHRQLCYVLTDWLTDCTVIKQSCWSKCRTATVSHLPSCGCCGCRTTITAGAYVLAPTAKSANLQATIQTMRGYGWLCFKNIHRVAYCLPLRARYGNYDRFDALQGWFCGVTNVMPVCAWRHFLLQLPFCMRQCATIGNFIPSSVSILCNWEQPIQASLMGSFTESSSKLQ